VAHPIFTKFALHQHGFTESFDEISAREMQEFLAILRGLEKKAELEREMAKMEGMR